MYKTMFIFSKHNVYNYLTPIMCMLEQIFTQSNIHIIKALLDNKYTVRDLAKFTKLSPAKISQFLKLTTKLNLTTINKHKKTKEIKLNTNEPLTREILALIIFNEISSLKSIKKIKPKYVGLFGSASTGNIDSKSDVDLFILTQNKLTLLEENQIKKEIENETKKEIDLTILTTKEFNELKINDPIFYNELKNSKTIKGSK
jgi:predicted nucleotidyltransferase